MRVKELIGREVLDANVKKIGKVSDLEVDIAKGLVEYIEVKAGLTKGYNVGLDKIHVVGEKIILKVKQEEL